MNYVLLNKTEYISGDYKIVPIREEDRFPIMQWRNEQLEILRQSRPLTEHDQDNYFKNVVIPDFNSVQPRQILFSYFFKKELIGYGGIVHLNWLDKRGEISFLLETSRNQDISIFKKEYALYLQLIKVVAFQELKLNKITTEAFDLRPYLVETLEANGFVLEGILKNHNYINNRYVDSLLHACFEL